MKTQYQGGIVGIACNAALLPLSPTDATSALRGLTYSPRRYMQSQRAASVPHRAATPEAPMAVRLGLSPCPNDTYIFSAFLEGRVPMPGGLGPVQPHFADVEELNRLAREGQLEVTKISASAVADVLDEYVVLNSGGALGRGCGPLLVAPQPLSVADLTNAAIAVPGLMTTANLLLSLAGSFKGLRRAMSFDAIMPALQRGEYAAGVIIHESRFTFADHGLHRVLDLGAWWEAAMNVPIPLGVIVGKRSLGQETLVRMEETIRQSLVHANAHPAEGAAFVRRHAQEMDEDVLARHIATFVTEFSLDLGPAGQDAVARLVAAAATVRGIALPTGTPMFLETR